MARMSGNTVDYSNYFFIDWGVNGQNIPGNYSNIGWAAYWHFQGNDRQLDNGYANLGDVNRWSNGGRVYNYAGNFTTRDLLVASGSFDIGHNADGTKTLNVAGGLTGYSGQRSEGSGSWALPTIPRHATLNWGQSFNDEANPQFNYSNPAGTAVDFWLETPVPGGTVIAPRTLGSGGGGTVTLTLTTGERNALLARCVNSATLTVRFVIHDTLGGVNAWSYLDYTMTVINGNPTFTAAEISYIDTSSAVVAITGNNQKIVQNNSDLNVTFTAATPLKSATIASYKVTLDTNIQTKTTPQTIDYNTVNLSANTPVTIEVTDSRGFKTTANKTITILPWSLPSAVVSIKRVNNYENSTKIKADVTIASVDGTNAIQVLKARYKKVADVTWTEEALVTGVEETLTLDKLFEWNIEIVVTDKFGTTTYTALLAKGIPILFLDNVKLSVGVGMFPSGTETLEVADQYLIPIMKKIYAVGDILMTTNSANPNTRAQLAGTTWTAWGTGRVPVGIDTGQSEFNTIEKTGGHKLLQSHNHDHYQWLMNGAGASGAHYGFGYQMNTGALNSKTSYTTSGEVQMGNAAAGGGDSQNLQPYITCYYWKRTA